MCNLFYITSLLFLFFPLITLSFLSFNSSQLFWFNFVIVQASVPISFSFYLFIKIDRGVFSPKLYSIITCFKSSEELRLNIFRMIRLTKPVTLHLLSLDTEKTPFRNWVTHIDETREGKPYSLRYESFPRDLVDSSVSHLWHPFSVSTWFILFFWKSVIRKKNW